MFRFSFVIYIYLKTKQKTFVLRVYLLKFNICTGNLIAKLNFWTNFLIVWWTVTILTTFQKRVIQQSNLPKSGLLRLRYLWGGFCAKKVQAFRSEKKETFRKSKEKKRKWRGSFTKLRYLSEKKLTKKLFKKKLHHVNLKWITLLMFLQLKIRTRKI